MPVSGPLELTPATAPGNVLVDVTGQSTMPSATCLLILDTTEAGSCQVSDTGAVTGGFVVPTVTSRSAAHTVYVCLGFCKGRARQTTFALPQQWLAGSLTVPDWIVDPLIGTFRAGGGPAIVTGTGFSPGGDACQILAGSVRARCSVSPDGILTGSLPVLAGTQSGSYPVSVTNVVSRLRQSGGTTLNVIRSITTPAPPPTSPAVTRATAASTEATSTAATSTGGTSAASSSPAGHAPSSSPGGYRGDGGLPWRTIAEWGGGIGGGLLLLAGAAFSTLRWRRRPRTLPSVRVKVRPRPWSTPRLVGVHSSHLHAVHLRMRAAGVTSFQPPRREE